MVGLRHCLSPNHSDRQRSLPASSAGDVRKVLRDAFASLDDAPKMHFHYCQEYRKNNSKDQARRKETSLKNYPKRDHRQTAVGKIGYPNPWVFYRVPGLEPNSKFRAKYA